MSKIIVHDKTGDIIVAMHLINRFLALGSTSNNLVMFVTKEYNYTVKRIWKTSKCIFVVTRKKPQVEEIEMNQIIFDDMPANGYP